MYLGGGEEEKLIWPGEEEASTVPHKYTDFIKMMNSAKATPTGGQKYQNISIFETENDPRARVAPQISGASFDQLFDQVLLCLG